MKYLFYLLAILLLFCCTSNKIIVELKKKKGLYTNLNYVFSDNRIRNVSIHFDNDSVLTVSNNVYKEHSHSAYKYNFEESYRYQEIELGVISIVCQINGNNKDKYLEEYVKPYVNSTFINERSIFPNLLNDTIRFSSDFKRIQIKEFNLVYRD